MKQFIAHCDRLSTNGTFIESPTKNISETPLTITPSATDKAYQLPGVKVVGHVDLSKFERKKVEIQPEKKNYYIIDTNVFINCPDILSKIDTKYPIILSAKVIDELDKFKIRSEQEKKNAETALRLLNRESTREIKFETAEASLLPPDYDRRSPDNLILSVALKYKKDHPIMLTSDNGLQLKCKALGITTISLKVFLKKR